MMLDLNKIMEAYRTLEDPIPLLTRLVDEVEVLKAALERIKTHEVVGMPFTTIESLRLIADNATAAHQKRWEDLK